VLQVYLMIKITDITSKHIMFIPGVIISGFCVVIVSFFLLVYHFYHFFLSNSLAAREIHLKDE